MPYYGYGRQDRKDQPRVPIGAKLMANMIVTPGADRVLGIDFHQHQLQGFFDIPVDHLYAMPVFTTHYRKKQLNDPVVVAPDVGSAKMARGFAKRLNAIAGDHRQAAARGQRVRGGQRGRRSRRAGLYPGRRHDRHRRDRHRSGAGAQGSWREGHLYLCNARAVSGPAVQRLTTRRSRKWR